MAHILERERTSRSSKAWRLSKLGWTQEEIATSLDVTQGLISQDIKNSHLGKINSDLGPHWNDKGIAELANRLNLSLTDAYAAARRGEKSLSFSKGKVLAKTDTCPFLLKLSILRLLPYCLAWGDPLL